MSVDAGVRIEAIDLAGLERLLRYCARPPFSMERLKQRGADLVYRCGKGHTEPMQSDKYSGGLVLTPLQNFGANDAGSWDDGSTSASSGDGGGDWDT